MPSGIAWRRFEVLDPGRGPQGEREGFCYLDTETTGLSFGTGTMVFAATVARAGGAGLEVAQVFLREPGAEAAFLEAVAAELDGAAGLGTYNGASFDLPILRTRWALARLPGELHRVPHTDLLHLVRGLLGRRLESRTLREVEMRVLGFEREDDLPGALAPEAYFGYLRRGTSPLLEPALAHNRQDAVSLYHLHQRLLDRLHLRERGLDGDDLYDLGRVLTRRGRRADGWRAWRLAARQADGVGSAAAGVLLARRLVRTRRAAAAEVLLRDLQQALPGDPGLAVARARVLEWRLRDPARALAIVEAALLEPGAYRADLESRRDRLRRKLQLRRRRDDRVGVEERPARRQVLQVGDQLEVVAEPVLPDALDGVARRHAPPGAVA